MSRYTSVSGVPPKWKKKRKIIGTHNGGSGSQFDADMKKRYVKKGWKKLKSKDKMGYVV